MFLLSLVIGQNLTVYCTELANSEKPITFYYFVVVANLVVATGCLFRVWTVAVLLKHRQRIVGTGHPHLRHARFWKWFRKQCEALRLGVSSASAVLCPFLWSSYGLEQTWTCYRSTNPFSFVLCQPHYFGHRKRLLPTSISRSKVLVLSPLAGSFSQELDVSSLS